MPPGSLNPFRTVWKCPGSDYIGSNPKMLYAED